MSKVGVSIYGNGVALSGIMSITKKPLVGIIYLSYHAKRHVPDMIRGLQTQTYPIDQLKLIIVDNPHPDHGSLETYFEETLRPLQSAEFPETTILAQTENTGFAGGNNIGIAKALELGCEYVFFHNDDGYLHPNTIEELVQAMEHDPAIGLAQALMLLSPETHLINSAGNVFHYLGFGMTNEYRTPHASLQIPEISEVGYTSGAALLVHRRTILAHGGWETAFFMYHEDVEWSLRLRLLGYKIVLVREALFYHKYEFGRSIQKFFLQLRNRYAVLLMVYRMRTLLLLVPMLFILECGLLVFALKNKWIKEQLKVYQYWCSQSTWKLWLPKRRHLQTIRRVGDTEILKHATAVIQFQEGIMQHPLLTKIGNPLMAFWYRIVRAIVSW